MPFDLGGGSLDFIWIFSDHLSLGGNGFSKILSLFSSEILLEQIDLIVLHDTSSRVLGHFLGSR